MALSDISVADGKVSPVTHVFTYIGTTGNKCVRKDMAQAAETPWTLSIAHSTSMKNGKPVASHLTRFDVVLLDADGVTPLSCNIRVMADIPTAVVSDALADDLSALVRNWLSSANARTWVKGSIG